MLASIFPLLTEMGRLILEIKRVDDKHVSVAFYPQGPDEPKIATMRLVGTPAEFEGILDFAALSAQAADIAVEPVEKFIVKHGTTTDLIVDMGKPQSEPESKPKRQRAAKSKEHDEEVARLKGLIAAVKSTDQTNETHT